MVSLKIGGRSSQLSTIQMQIVKNAILQHCDIDLELKYIKTADYSELICNKSRFTKHIDAVLYTKEIDIGVHSMKDIFHTIDNNIMIAAILPRSTPYDVFVSLKYQGLDALPNGATVGTSSVRRKYFVKGYRPDLNILELRGNVVTRLQKLKDNLYDSIILAGSGLERLNIRDNIYDINKNIILPSIGQGAIGITILRSNADKLMPLLKKLNCPDSEISILCERAFVAFLDADCQSPIGALATITNNTINFEYSAIKMNTLEIYRDSISGNKDEYLNIAKIAANNIANWWS